MNYFDDRKLYSVSIGGFVINRTDEGTMMGTTVYMDITKHGDDQSSGPGIELKFAVSVSGESNFLSLQDQCLDRAIHLLRRVASFTDEELKAAFARDESYFPPKS